MKVIYEKVCGVDVHKSFIVAVIKGEKDDNKDAKWIAYLFKLGIVRSSFIPSKNFRILRELTRYVY